MTLPFTQIIECLLHARPMQCEDAGMNRDRHSLCHCRDWGTRWPQIRGIWSWGRAVRERCGAESGTWLSGGLCEVGKMIGVMSRVPVGVYWEWGGEGQPREGEQSGQTSQDEQGERRASWEPEEGWPLGPGPWEGRGGWAGGCWARSC